MTTPPSSQSDIHKYVRSIKRDGRVFFAVLDLLSLHVKVRPTAWPLVEAGLIEHGFLSADWRTSGHSDVRMASPGGKGRHALFVRGQVMQGILNIKALGVNLAPQFVYFLSFEQDKRFVRIGMTADPVSRMLAYQSHMPPFMTPVYLKTIETPDMKALETRIHAYLAPKRVQGEWFRLSLDEMPQVIRYAQMENKKLMEGGDRGVGL